MNCYQLDGDPIDAKALKLAGAKEVRDALAWYPFARLKEVRAHESSSLCVEAVIFEIEPELPQDREYDIRSIELIATVFSSHKGDSPEVFALRKDFPWVPHLFSTPANSPKHLCLYDDSWPEVKSKWTGAGFLGDIAQWLSLTAKDELHTEDQPPEPFLYTSANIVVFPESVFKADEIDTTYVGTIVQGFQRPPYTLKLQRFNDKTPSDVRRVFCAAIQGTPIGQGAIRNCPRTVSELNSTLSEVGIDLWSILRDRVKSWYSLEKPPHTEDSVVVLVRLPRIGEKSGREQSVEHLAFILAPIEELAMATGSAAYSSLGAPLKPLAAGVVDEALAREVSVIPLRAIQCLDRTMAKAVSGLEINSGDLKVVLVGVGALGSQVHNNLSRMGWGFWSLIDKDMFLPHNAPKHRLGSDVVGRPKVFATEGLSHIETPYNKVVRTFIADAQEVEDEDAILKTYRESDLILDMSTSIAVSRFLGRELDSQARRASLFLNPTGQDAVMLMEDRKRTVTLDSLEAQYYRSVLRFKSMKAHIRQSELVRYSSGCRDVTSRLAQDDLAWAAGLLSRQVRTVGIEASATVWQRQEDGSVDRIEIPVSNAIRSESEGWTVVLNEIVVSEMSCLRTMLLPDETGGVLIGYFDNPSRYIYIVDALPAPVDSIEHRDAFIRGYADLKETLKEIEARSGGQVSYVGEWHSHPDGVPVSPSQADEKLLTTIAGEVRVEGLPGLIIIVGENGCVGVHLRLLP